MAAPDKTTVKLQVIKVCRITTPKKNATEYPQSHFHSMIQLTMQLSMLVQCNNAHEWHRNLPRPHVSKKQATMKQVSDIYRFSSSNWMQNFIFSAYVLLILLFIWQFSLPSTQSPMDQSDKATMNNMAAFTFSHRPTEW